MDTFGNTGTRRLIAFISLLAVALEAPSLRILAVVKVCPLAYAMPSKNPLTSWLFLGYARLAILLGAEERGDHAASSLAAS